MRARWRPRSLPLGLLLTVAGCLAVPGWVSANPTPIHRELRDPPGEIRAEAGLERAVEQVAREWAISAPEIATDLQHDAPRPVEIVLLSQSTFARWSRGLLPEWGVGFANWPDGPIALDVGSISRGQKSLREVLRHEISHVYLGQRLGGIRPPRWYVEGVAQVQSGEWRFSDTLQLVSAASTDRLPRLSRLASRFPQGGNAAALAYRISLKAVLDLSRRHPELGGWRAVLEPTRRHGRFDTAFEEVYGLRLPAFEEELYGRLHSRYGWIAAVGGAGSLFGAMTVLFLAGYLRKRRRARRRLMEMEAEERALEMSPTPPS